MECPLCCCDQARHLIKADERDYYLCGVCGLAFLSPALWLRRQPERDRYTLHQNSPDAPDYRRFLGQLARHLVPRLPPRAEGLDYGSGPGPTLSVMLEELGFAVSIYDPYFAPDATALSRTYDFIICTETAEHFYRPGREFQRLDRMLRPGGWLGILTQMLEPGQDFANWWYRRDPTHVCFYTRGTMRWMARRHGWQAEFPDRNVALFHKAG